MKIYVSEKEIDNFDDSYIVHYTDKEDGKLYGIEPQVNVSSLEQHNKELLQEFQTKLIRAIVDKSKQNKMLNSVAFFVDDIFDDLLKERGVE